ncbi:hypothetical protein GOBAR_DD29073 [Gossypium barbadense]|nr:hypothetical protein GOBAR_DD29073 [Gossypium barbadense]
MKRVLDESSDDGWENHSFKPSRVSKKSPNPPPIKSFSFNSQSHTNYSGQSSDDCVEIQQLEDDGVSNLEDDDVEAEDVARPVNRVRRFVVDDDEEDNENACSDEVFDVESSEEMEELQEDDVVGKALQKCAKISTELRKELYGSSAASCERYAEVEASSVRIVTQNDVDVACGAADSAILADEMGLGKTIQAITYLTLLKHLKNDPGPHLIVCPASVLENWEIELKKWCPSFSVLQHHGAGRAAYSKELSSLSKAGLPPPFNVLLVCYSLFERHSGFYSVQQKDDRKILKRWHWSCVLMDEAHALKDKNSYRWKNLMSVARNAKQRLMLTGTPLQNDLHELWSLLEFMMPDLFATEDVDLKKLLNAEDRELVGRMKSILGPFILRRLKSDVMQQLVPKIQRVEHVIMEKQQEDAYREAIEEYRTISRARIAKLSESDMNNIVGILPQRQISNYFVQFRKIANHPLLVRRIYNDEDIVRFAKRLHSMGVFECTLDRVIEELKNYNDFSINRVEKEDRSELTRKTFKYWKRMRISLSIRLQIDRQAEDRCHRIGQIRPVTIYTQVTDRQTIVDDFNNDTSIFACLLSTRAGGQGLNLTGADTLVTKGTVDENVYEIAKRKLTLDAAVLESGIDIENEGDTSEKTMGQILTSLLMN